MNNTQRIVDALNNSPVFQEYQRAFSETTRLPLALRSVESWQLPHRGKKNENSLCAMMAQKSRACANCLQVQQKLSENAIKEPQTAVCAIGLSCTAVPVRMGDHLLGFLQTGQVFRKIPTPGQFEQTCKLCDRWGLDLNKNQLKEAYFSSPVIPLARYDSMVSLLAIFAQHLSMVGNQALLRQTNSEPAVILRAKQFIQENQAEDLSLAQVAKAVNTSTFYFCKKFKKTTGINFTDYLSRVRIEKAKNLLLNPSLRISEIAYEVGFQSLTHFNRVFKKIVGQAPTEYRAQLWGGK